MHTPYTASKLDFQYLCPGFINCPNWCNTYNMDLSSCLVFACNIPNLCFLVLSLHYCGDSSWSLHCGQVVQEKGEKQTPSRTKIFGRLLHDKYLHWITAEVWVSCYCWPWLHVCVCVTNRNQDFFPEYYRNVCTTLCYFTVLLRNTSYFSWWVSVNFLKYPSINCCTYVSLFLFQIIHPFCGDTAKSTLVSCQRCTCMYRFPV